MSCQGHLQFPDIDAFPEILTMPRLPMHCDIVTFSHTMGSLNIGQTPQSDKPIRTLYLHSLAVTPSHFAAKMCDLSD